VTVGRLPLAIAAALAALVAAAPAGAQDPPSDPVIADGVTVAGLDVGGLTGAEAREAVRAFFARPVRMTFAGKRLSARPYWLGARARVPQAVAAALAAPVDTALPLRVRILRGALRTWVERRANALERRPVSARIKLIGLIPRIVPAKPGRALRRDAARTKIRAALLAHRRSLGLPVRWIRPRITARQVGPAVVIKRGSRRLHLYRGSSAGKMNRVRSFPVAVGQPAWPTPLGSFSIRTKTRNPWWYPPNQPWAAGAQPIPPGPGNPLGTRWMGLNIGGVGIHGTYNSGSIGTAASHGCIRMHIASAEWLFERVRIGTPVYIVAS
jgi:lipoprotein-anchoring transpeptidase ErfK/SrfK